jgi:N6-L-threonylcarbamoyladenine synthase
LFIKSMPTLLAIETSCDETAAAVVTNRHVLSSIVASQIAIHLPFGGVVPEVASRRHVEVVQEVVDQSLKEAGLGIADLDAIAVTCAPGLVGSLLVGVMAAKTLALIYDKPLIGVHHLEGHLFSGFLTAVDLQPPCLSLLVSGGHTSLIHIQAEGIYTTVGQTRDDAVGEAFDKVARLLDLGYPGGPAIDRLASQGDPDRFPLPEGKVDHPFDTSFSGLKTAVLRLVQTLKQNRADLPVADLAASFQATVTRVLTHKTIACAQSLALDRILLTGGVAANRELRGRLLAAGEESGIQVIVPPFSLCTDNAAMIAAAGVSHFIRGDRSPLSLGVQSRLPLEQLASLYRQEASASLRTALG